MIVKALPVSAVELELSFLHHLAWRAHFEQGRYLSDLDREALNFLNSQHPQDVADTSVRSFAISEFQRLNPDKEITMNIKDIDQEVLEAWQHSAKRLGNTLIVDDNGNITEVSDTVEEFEPAGKVAP